MHVIREDPYNTPSNKLHEYKDVLRLTGHILIDYLESSMEVLTAVMYNTM